MVPIEISFNFLADELSSKNEFRYQVSQKYSTISPVKPSHLTGNLHIIIRKEDRNAFDANAGDDKEIIKGEQVAINAIDIGEIATYNWYDSSGNLIFTGKDITVSPDITEEYQLEVIAADGVKDYSEVTVVVKEHEILNMSPNPTGNVVTINYKTTNIASAYLMIISPFNSAYNYILDVNQTQTVLDLSNYQTGTYTVLLICDGQLADSKNLIKQ